MKEKASLCMNLPFCQHPIHSFAKHLELQLKFSTSITVWLCELESTVMVYWNKITKKMCHCSKTLWKYCVVYMVYMHLTVEPWCDAGWKSTPAQPFYWLLLSPTQASPGFSFVSLGLLKFCFCMFPFALFIIEIYCIMSVFRDMKWHYPTSLHAKAVYTVTWTSS